MQVRYRKKCFCNIKIKETVDVNTSEALHKASNLGLLHQGDTPIIGHSTHVDGTIEAIVLRKILPTE